MSEQKNKNNEFEKSGLKKSRKQQFFNVLIANEEIKRLSEKKRAREEEFYPSVTELMKSIKK